MKDDMMEERRTWFTNELAMGEEFPEDLSRFYAAKNPPTEPTEETDGKKKGKKKGKEKKGGKKDKKGGKKGKKGKKAGDSDEAKELPPPLTAAEAAKSSRHCTKIYHLPPISVQAHP